jgi:hypothetical protein
MRSKTMVLLLSTFLATSYFFLQMLAPLQVRGQQTVLTQASREERGLTTESSSVTLKELPAEDRNLDEQQQKRLRVTWDKPKRKIDKGGRRPRLEICGTLSLLQKDGKTLKPVDWPLPVSVVLSRWPNKKLDWSRWHDRRDSLWSDILVGRELIIGSRSTPDGGFEPIPLPKKPAGVFTGTFPLSEIHSPIGGTKSFQVGLCLGEKKGKTVTWRNVVPILPQTVEMLEVSGPKPLSRTLQFINACPTPISWDFEPIALVRAANHLKSLGKDKAIASLREFLELAYDTGYTRDRIDPENIDTSNQWCLASLVPLVFDNAGEKDDITVWQGIPFHTVVISGTSGWPSSTRPLVDAADQHGTLIEKPLRPANNPLEAADALFEKIAKPADRDLQGFGNGLRQHLREQAWRSIRHLLDRSEKSPDLSSQAEWDKLKAKVVRLKIRWNEERQDYVAAEKPK